MFGVVFFFTVLALARGQTTQVEQCSAGYGDPPINTFIDGCTTMPCNVVQGEDAVINVIFEAPHTIRSMNTIARVSFLFMTFNYSLGENEVTCNHLQNTYCPLQKGEVVQYTLRMFIEPVFPTVSASVDFLVEDSFHKPIWCARIRIQVISPSRQRRISQNSISPDQHRFMLNFQNSTNL